MKLMSTLSLALAVTATVVVAQEQRGESQATVACKEPIFEPQS